MAIEITNRMAGLALLTDEAGTYVPDSAVKWVAVEGKPSDPAIRFLKGQVQYGRPSLGPAEPGQDWQLGRMPGSRFRRELSAIHAARKQLRQAARHGLVNDQPVDPVSFRPGKTWRVPRPGHWFPRALIGYKELPHPAQLFDDATMVVPGREEIPCASCRQYIPADDFDPEAHVHHIFLDTGDFIGTCPGCGCKEKFYMADMERRAPVRRYSPEYVQEFLNWLEDGAPVTSPADMRIIRIRESGRVDFAAGGRTVQVRFPRKAAALLLADHKEGQEISAGQRITRLLKAPFPRIRSLKDIRQRLGWSEGLQMTYHRVFLWTRAIVIPECAGHWLYPYDLFDGVKVKPDLTELWWDLSPVARWRRGQVIAPPPLVANKEPSPGFRVGVVGVNFDAGF